MLRCYKQEKTRVAGKTDRQMLASKDGNTEVEGTMALEATTRQQSVKTQLTEKTSYML
jgi:hypothetical protein